jgi:hypothetical protein
MNLTILFRSVVERLKLLLATAAAQELEADFLARAAERQADLLRQAAQYEKEGLAQVAAGLRQQAEAVSPSQPLANLTNTSAASLPSTPVPEAATSQPTAALPAPVASEPAPVAPAGPAGNGRKKRR